MHNTPPPYLMTGIQLVQAGRRADALSYLRYAAQTEALTAEGWLWLAAATDDLEEYRVCVNQALQQDRQHPIATRMRAELEQLAGQGSPAPGAAPAWNGPGSPSVPRRPARRRVWIELPLLALLVIAVVIVALVVSGVLPDVVRDTLNTSAAHMLNFTIGDGASSYHFRVEVPDSWLPANTDSPDWRTARDRLAAAFPAAEGQTSVWEQVEASFSAVARDPVYGVVMPQPRLVETGTARLQQDGIVAVLTLSQIVPLPDPPAGEPDDACARMRLLEMQFKEQGALAAQPDSTLMGAELTTRSALGDCAYWIDRRYTNQAPYQVPFPVTLDGAPDATRIVLLAVPAGTERYALWTISLADSGYDSYKNTIQRIIRTLDTVGAS